LLRAVLGLVPCRGEITVDGAQAGDRAGWKARRSRVAWVPQRPAVGRFPLLVRELLASSGSLPAAVEAAERLGVAHLLDRPLHTLSGGQLQRSFWPRGSGTWPPAPGCCSPTSDVGFDFDTRDLVGEVLAAAP
jgi:ABC-type Mn2+/Zn2+ transport system ATPase subunit